MQNTGGKLQCNNVTGIPYWFATSLMTGKGVEYCEGHERKFKEWFT